MLQLQHRFRAGLIPSINRSVLLEKALSRRMTSHIDIEALGRKISEKYSACDVSDALLKLKVPNAGFLPDISPIPRKGVSRLHIVAPISTIIFVPKDHQPGVQLNAFVPAESNMPKGKHWSDLPSPGTIALLQQPQGQICAVLGDIMATRLKIRGVKGVVADGRVRDIVSISDICDQGNFTCWSKGFSTVGTGLQAKPWAYDVPIRIGDVVVRPGDLLCADEGERGLVVIPQEQIQAAAKLFPSLKEADDKVVADVQSGVDVSEAFRRHR
ncbi:RraA-like protein [Polychaeton citri CBS 116435]|uniref:RraA-like protein n=1 Tax=Polychaeton citri CBS 116435 TaxID=1314669 RepID=A0A9P4Q814_9PEZI|nr:RraA-like protein [Polychaeton citri CBS 116435]